MTRNDQVIARSEPESAGAHRGLEERRELIRSGAIEKIRAARDAAREAAEQT
jgi:hypothetical protein